jgi:hypothetical protein
VSVKRLDIVKAFASEYVAPKKPTLVRLTKAHYLGIEGRGAPGGPDFATRLGALYNVAFTVKMARKFAGRDYTVSKLEGLWWVTGRRRFIDAPPHTWHWKLLIRTPGFITAKEVRDTALELREKGKPAEVSEVALETLDERTAVQMLHVGPYDREAETIAQMDAFARANELSAHGRHHEIYLSDPRRVDPARLRTILRQPVR